MNCHFLFDDFWMISECFLMVLHVVYAAMPLTKNHLPASCSGTAEPVNLEAAKTNSNEYLEFYEWLVGGWLPLWKIWVRQLGWLFPIYGKIKFMFQTTNQIKKWGMEDRIREQHFLQAGDVSHQFAMTIRRKPAMRLEPVSDHPLQKCILPSDQGPNTSSQEQVWRCEKSPKHAAFMSSPLLIGVPILDYSV